MGDISNNIIFLVRVQFLGEMRFSEYNLFLAANLLSDFDNDRPILGYQTIFQFFFMPKRRTFELTSIVVPLTESFISVH